MTNVDGVEGDRVIAEMGSTCLLMRSRLIARVVTALHDDKLRPYGIGSPQFALLVVIARLEPATRAEIGRFHRQDRSTLTRNLKIILSNAWAKEVRDEPGSRGRPIVLTDAGRNLLVAAAPAWRKAQAETRAVLGAEGVTAVTTIANGLIDSGPRI